MSSRSFINVGSVDRTLRVLIGLTLLMFVFIGPQTSWGWLGVLVLATAGAGFCPLYSLLGISTCRTAAK